MSITFSSGGFDGTMRTDASGNIFIETTGNSKTINIGGLKEITGSIERTLDKATGKVIEETEKDIATGKTFHRSSSATENQIEFQQNSSGAFIIVSGSNPGFTIYKNDIGDRAIRTQGDVFLSASQFLSTGVNMDGSSLDYYIHMNHIGGLGTTQDFGDSNGTGYLMVSQSGDTRVSKNLIVDGGITISGNIKNTQTLQMTNSSSVIDTFNTASFRSAKYVLQVTSASKYQVSEMLVLHNDGTALNTEYAQLNSGANLINFTTDVNNSNVRLNAAGSSISCSVRYDRTIIPL